MPTEIEQQIEREASEAASYYRRAQKSRENFWRTIAGLLLTVLVAVGVHTVDATVGITRAEAATLVAGPANPYVQERAALYQRVQNLEELKAAIDNLQRQLNRVCIALGVDPNGPTETYPRKAMR